MSNKKTRPTNQTIEELCDEYTFDLQTYLDAFIKKYGYYPEHPDDYKYTICPPEVQRRSLQFWNDYDVIKSEILSYTFAEALRNL